MYYYFDEDDHRCIIEWCKLRHKQGGNSDLTFQVILYDKDVWITESGDPNILFQYRSIAQAAGPRDGASEYEKNSPFTGIYKDLLPLCPIDIEVSRSLSLFYFSEIIQACIPYFQPIKPTPQ